MEPGELVGMLGSGVSLSSCAKGVTRWQRVPADGKAQGRSSHTSVGRTEIAPCDPQPGGTFRAGNSSPELCAGASDGGKAAQLQDREEIPTEDRDQDGLHLLLRACAHASQSGALRLWLRVLVAMLGAKFGTRHDVIVTSYR